MFYRVVGLTGYVGAGKNEAANGLMGTHLAMSIAEPIRKGLLALNPLIDISSKITTTVPSATAEIEGETILDTLQIRLESLVKSLGWDKAKQHPEVRRLIQRYGTEAGRDIHGYDCWTKLAKSYMADHIDNHLDTSGLGLVVTDVRFPEERELIKSFDGIVVSIIRPGCEPVNDHCSETQEVKVDFVIHNNGTVEELHDKIKTLVLFGRILPDVPVVKDSDVVELGTLYSKGPLRIELRSTSPERCSLMVQSLYGSGWVELRYWISPDYPTKQQIQDLFKGLGID